MRQGNPEKSFALIATGNTQCRDEPEASGRSTPQSSSPPVTNLHLPDEIDMTMITSLNCIVNLSYFVEELTEVMLDRLKSGSKDSRVCVAKMSSIGLRTNLVAERGARG